jgi:HD-like signal output (HDOD) protein
MESLKELTQYIDRFPTLPRLALGAAEALDDPDCDLRRVADLIALDPVLAAQVIRMANSALFAGTARTDSLVTAISRLGLRETHNTVMTVAVMNTIPSLPEPLSVHDFWTQGLGTALCSKHMAKGLGYTNAAQAYLGGLVHSLGEAYLAIFFTDRYRKALDAAQTNKTPKEVAIAEEFKIGHPDLCARILRKWNFRKAVTEAVKFHLTPDLAPREKVLASILFAADRIWRDLGIGIGEADHSDQPWVAEIPAEFLDRITGLGYPDVTFYLMEQREFVSQVREVVQVTFAAMTHR